MLKTSFASLRIFRPFPTISMSLKRSASTSSAEAAEAAEAPAVVSVTKTTRLAKKVGSTTKSTTVQTKLNFSAASASSAAAEPLLKKAKASAPRPQRTADEILASNPELEGEFKKHFPKLDVKENLPLLELELTTMAKDWLEVFAKEMVKPSFLTVSTYRTRHLCPPSSIGLDL